MKYVGEQSDRTPFRQCIFIWGCQSSTAPAKKHSKTAREQCASEMSLASRTIFCRRYWKACIKRYHHDIAAVLYLLKEWRKVLPRTWCEPMRMKPPTNTRAGYRGLGYAKSGP